MTQFRPVAAEPGSVVPPLIALAAIGIGYVWASWSAREADLRDRTLARLA
jgi:hypothetical protein